MKVLFDARVHLNYHSGISRYIICLLESYLELFPQDQVTVLLNPTIKIDNVLYKRLEPFRNVNFVTINTAHMGPKNYLVMGRIIKKMKPDVYHYPHLDAPVFTGNIPVVATVHDTNSYGNVKKYNDFLGVKSFYFRNSLGLTLKYASAVIFVSESVLKDVAEKYHLSANDQRLHRIYNGLETDFNVIDSAAKSLCNLKFNFQSPYFLYVGQIREHKNVHRIVAAFEIFQKKIPDYKLVLIGHNYLNRSFDNSNIIQIDKVSDTELKCIYSDASAFLFPTLFEGFGFPVLEAFSFGKRVLTTNYGATKEISGGFADLVDPLSVEEIASGMELLLKDDGKNEMRKNHAQNFSWKENAVKLREIYCKCISG